MLEVSILPKRDGRGPLRFPTSLQHDAAIIIYHLEEAHGPGTLADSQGNVIEPDPTCQLKPEQYFFTLSNAIEGKTASCHHACRLP